MFRVSHKLVLSLIFLNSESPKKKIKVTSIFNGEPCDYEIKSTINDEITTYEYNTSVEEYINKPFDVNNYTPQYDIEKKWVTDKTLTHFMLDMSTAEQKDDNTDGVNTTPHLLYIQQKNPKSGEIIATQELEIFYDWKLNPNNYERNFNFKEKNFTIS